MRILTQLENSDSSWRISTQLENFDSVRILTGFRKSGVFQDLGPDSHRIPQKWSIPDSHRIIASQKYHQVQKVSRKSDLDGEMVKSTAGVRMS